MSPLLRERWVKIHKDFQESINDVDIALREKEEERAQKNDNL